MKYNTDKNKVIVEFGTTPHCKRMKELLIQHLDSLIIIEKYYCAKQDADTVMKNSLKTEKEVITTLMPEIKKEEERKCDKFYSNPNVKRGDLTVAPTPKFTNNVEELETMPDLDLGDIQGDLL